MQPNPSAETSNPLFPSVRFFMWFSLPSCFAHPDTMACSSPGHDTCPNDGKCAIRLRIYPLFLQTGRSRCLVNHLHLFFIHPATVHFDFRDGSVDLTKIRRRQHNIDGS